MNCLNVINQLDDYLDGGLPPAEAAELHRHLEGCRACAAELRERSALRRELSHLPAPAARPQVLERVLAAAVQSGNRSAPAQSRRHVWQGAGLATAAALLLAVGFTLGRKTAGHRPLDVGPQVVLAAQPVQVGPTAESIALMFRSTTALNDASISVWLPEDVQIAGRPHVRHLSWHTDLKPGPNLLELPLQSVGPRGGTLVVRLSQGSLVKTLEIPITVKAAKDPGTALQSATPLQGLT